MNSVTVLAGSPTGTGVANAFTGAAQPAILAIGVVILGVLVLWFFFAHLSQGEKSGFRMIILETLGIAVLGAVILYVINTVFL
ncbi:MAG: hypothetical protein ACREF7_00980 [Candidatus Saccharimonadales bacterium]